MLKAAWKKKVGWMLLLSLMFMLIGGGSGVSVNHGEISLHTTYTEITVPPGESIRFNVDVLNHTTSQQEIEVDVKSEPDGWEYDLTSGGWDTQKITLQSNESQSFNFNVAEQGTYRTEWTSKQLNLEGHVDSDFNFNTKIENRIAEEQSYALRAEVPRGWDVQFKDGSDRVASVTVQPNATKSLIIDVLAPPETPAGTYSRGMRQRLGLADVLIKKPEIIILDEPTLGIDPKGVRELLELIRQLSRDDGITVLLSSHHLHQVQQIRDRVGLFVHGKLLAMGDVESLSSQLFEEEPILIEVHITAVTEELEERLASIEDIQHIERIPEGFHFKCSSDVSSDIAETVIQTGSKLKYLSKKQFGLDEIYQHYFEGGKNTNAAKIQ